jgi:hypothetical protein
MTPQPHTVRDHGLALISRVNRWLIVAAVAFSGLISLVAAHAFHGRTVSAGGSSPEASTPPGQSQSSAEYRLLGGWRQRPQLAAVGASASLGTSRAERADRVRRVIAARAGRIPDASRQNAAQGSATRTGVRSMRTLSAFL